MAHWFYSFLFIKSLLFKKKMKSKCCPLPTVKDAKLLNQTLSMFSQIIRIVTDRIGVTFLK